MFILHIIPVLLVIITFAASPAIGGEGYTFPLHNPYEATVIGTPPHVQARFPDNIPTEIVRLKAYPQRNIPDIFWFENGLACSLSAQQGPAPLIFIVAGTGARYDSPKMLDLQRAFYQAGFHVFCISSPTHMDFIINASASMVPGMLEEDARDLYRIMCLARKKFAENNLEVSHYHLTGYSLGAIQAAYIAQRDKREQAVGLEKILLINPPFNIYRSVTILDQLLENNIPGGLNNFQPWLDEVMQNFSDIYKEMGYFEFSGEYIYKVHQCYPRREPFLKAVIGLSFRLSSSNMIFTTDIMRGGGYITPQHTHFSSGTDLTPYAMVATRTTFEDYFHEYLLPYVRSKNPGITESELIEMLSFLPIESFLKKADNIGLLHNQDDIILDDGDIERLQSIFGARAKIFPQGGHCGNLNHVPVVRYLVSFFSAKDN